jgi:hypothetical protein
VHGAVVEASDVVEVVVLLVAVVEVVGDVLVEVVELVDVVLDVGLDVEGVEGAEDVPLAHATRPTDSSTNSERRGRSGWQIIAS